VIKEQTNTAAIERQLDEPAPILVWRNGGEDYRIARPPSLRTHALCYPTREDAMRTRRSLWPARDAPFEPEPFRVVLEEYVAMVRRKRPSTSVALIDGDLNIIEVYR
jgi:hypothetical protein